MAKKPIPLAADIVRDRVKELRRVPAKSLRANVKNWRSHPADQRRALEGILREVGFADVLLVRELPDGQLEILDGHLRQDVMGDAMVPVVVLDEITDDEADKILTSHDPLAAMAEFKPEALENLLRSVQTEDKDLAEFFKTVQKDYGIEFETDKPDEPDKIIDRAPAQTSDAARDAQIRSIQLFFSAEQFKEFEGMLALLGPAHGSDNATDTVFRVMHRAVQDLAPPA